ncbi:L-carnitine dehydratase/bile acid-inducible protein F [Ferroglobus placidus DSM 10642]|uniref:L-carnitine dehydratase/bile acid-inducible protein F n=1 Tax=Ferroglobus placidus (strain DSM 10642 / AEDII12DO) TaxID=589924 RepID=D3S2A5_FERPA|nr:CoA transferase [Ferroglobus placidus]ADC66596.1 L-carnitine dehydratase/bile acid-inducible protein F [Ferroglobus placidus DSM 10642]
MEEMSWADWARENTDPRKAHLKPEALEDVVVLDLSYGSFAGLYASSLLAEYGAKVIRIEPPEGDIARKMTPFGIKHKDTGLAYIVEGRNKYHITLDITKEKGRKLLKKLVKKADVLIETYPPGYMDELGIGYRQLRKINPQLIYCAIHSFGHFGPKAKTKMRDYDVIDQAMGGIVWTTGIPEDYEEYPEHTRVPTKLGNWMGWYVGGGFAAFGIMVALFWRRKSGKGQFIDVAPPEAMAKVTNYYIQYYHYRRKVINRVANFDPAVFVYTLARAKDGMVFMAGFSDINFYALTQIIGRPDLREKYPTIRERLTPENWPVCLAEIEKWSRERTVKEIIDAFLAYKGEGTAVAGEVLKPIETFKVENWWDRGIFQEIDDPEYGKLVVQSVVAKFEKTPGRIKWVCRRVGADNDYIYKEFLGLNKSDLEELKKEGVI